MWLINSQVIVFLTETHRMVHSHIHVTLQILTASDFTVNHEFLKEQRPTQYCSIELSANVHTSYIFTVH